MPYRALYRKYRPRRFADIVGQPGVVQALSGQVAAGRISHAYLFSGPRGTGKTSAAKVLARAINCERNENGEACGACRPCTELLNEANMDVAEIDAASNNSVDKVREMLENVKYMPAVGRYRVYIVDEVHMLSTSAFNALLKTLEEPPAHVVFILATTEPHKLPATVLSRCQQFQFRRIPVSEMAGMLCGVLKAEGAEADPEAVQAIARASDGGMRDALSLLDQCLSLSQGRVTKKQVLGMLGTSDSAFFFDTAEKLLDGDAAGAVGLLDRFINDGGDVRTFAVDLTRHMRDLFVASYVKDAASALDLTGEDAQLLRDQAARHAPGDMLKCMGILSELEGSLRYAANPRIYAELAMFRCCRTEKEGGYDALLARVERLEARLNAGEKAPVRQPAAAPVPVDSQPRGEPPALPWDEPPPAFAGAKPPMLLDEEEAEDAAGEPPDVLPGQIDLFSAAEPPSAPPRDAAQPPNTGAAMKAGKLWAAVLKALEKSPLLGFAQKGKATAFDGKTLTVTFIEEDKAAADMLLDGRRSEKLAAAVSEAAGHPVGVTLEVSRWSDKEQKFIKRSVDALGDIPFEIVNNRQEV